MSIESLELTDRTRWDDTLFGDLYSAVVAEYKRRVRVKSAEQQLRQVIGDQAVEDGRVDGAVWVQPQGAHNSYLEGDTVFHDGKTWVALLNGTVWEPGVSGWRELTVDGTPPEFITPTGLHDSYSIGDQVNFEGAVYESLIDSNTWSPTDNPAGWVLVP